MKKYLFLLILLLQFSCNKKKHEKIKSVYVDALYDKAWYFKENNISDSSFIYFNLAKEKALNINDNIKIAKCLINMAIISEEKGDYFSSIEISLSAIRYLNSSNDKERELLSSVYNELGKASHLLKKYDDANKFILKAISLTKSENSKAIYLNNLAMNYSYQKQYAKAIVRYDELLNMAIIKSDKNNYVRTLSNYAKTKWLQDSSFNAAPIFLKALQFRIKNRDFIGLNASYSHLSNYYFKSKPDSALYYANEMYQVAKTNKSPSDQVEALQMLIKLSPSPTSKQYFNQYQNLTDSIYIANSNDKNQFALIRYETEKQKADNLVLQKENSEKKYQIIIISSLTLFILAGGIFWYRRRKKDIEAQSQKAIRENKLKTSQKVHDVVANGLYRIMSKLDNQETLKYNPIVNEIEELYEQSRDLSYEKPQSKNQDFHNHIFELLKSFASENTRVILVGNSAPLWEKVSEQAKDEIAHILQELMVNMAKHSQASDVVIKFEQVQQKINIYYTDNGIGIAGKPQAKNGLTNTGSRIDAIGGTITFDTKVEKGLKIQISFPVS